MAQHDYDLANASGAAFRGDLNDALSAIVSLNSGSSAPATTFAWMYWLDTSTSPPTLKQRNAANTAWVTVGTLDASNGWTPGDQSWHKQQYFTPAALSIASGASVDWDLDVAQVATLNLDEDVTLENPSNQQAGAIYRLRVTQDTPPTGGWGITFSASYDFGDAGTPTLSGDDGKLDELVFASDGTNMQFLGIATGFN